MKRIGVYTGNRADYGILKNLIFELKELKSIKTLLYTGGAHYSSLFGNTYKEIIKDRIRINFKSNLRINNINNTEILNFFSKSIAENTKQLKRKKPDVVIILGDRYEAYAFAITAFFLNIKIIHIHGGELTQGAFDDSIRHSISKLSDYHFVTHKKYKKRLIQLGERRKNIFMVGSLGVESFVKFKKIPKKILFKKHKIPLSKKIALVTFHPETRSKIKIKKQIQILLSSLKNLKNIFLIITYNNPDTYGDYYIKQIIKFNKNNNNSTIIKSMGSENYYSFLTHVDLVIGNSSSGIIEAPSAKTPTLDIGDRQLGRIKSSSVFNCKLQKNQIIKMTYKILKKKNLSYKNEYYKKNTKKLIVKAILKILKSKLIPNKKFHDIKF